MKPNSSSWQQVGEWYNKIVGNKGHYYHDRVILPRVIKLMNLRSGEKVLDLACGQGVLARRLPVEVKYVGVDLASNLIDEARRLDKNKDHRYVVADVTQRIGVGEKFNWVVMILALQNLERPFGAIKNASDLIESGGHVLLVINHPAFRIPKHSDWIVVKNKQWRMVDIYMSNLKIPIESSPFDKRNNQISFSFHYPLSKISQMLSNNSFVITKIEEWMSDKTSTGGMARIENQARREVPLFMTIVAKKI